MNFTILTESKVYVIKEKSNNNSLIDLLESYEKDYANNYGHNFFFAKEGYKFDFSLNKDAPNKDDENYKKKLSKFINFQNFENIYINKDKIYIAYELSSGFIPNPLKKIEFERRNKSFQISTKNVIISYPNFSIKGKMNEPNIKLGLRNQKYASLFDASFTKKPKQVLPLHEDSIIQKSNYFAINVYLIDDFKILE